MQHITISIKYFWWDMKSWYNRWRDTHPQQNAENNHINNSCSCTYETNSKCNKLSLIMIFIPPDSFLHMCNCEICMGTNTMGVVYFISFPSLIRHGLIFTRLISESSECFWQNIHLHQKQRPILLADRREKID